MRSEFKPTHWAYLRSHYGVEVCIPEIPGPAYTQAEWESGTNADIEILAEGVSGTFQGRGYVRFVPLPEEGKQLYDVTCWTARTRGAIGITYCISAPIWAVDEKEAEDIYRSRYEAWSPVSATKREP